MARQNIEIGVAGNDGTGDSIREAFRKVNENFRDLYAVFGAGDFIKSTNLDDFPATYDAGQIFVVNDAGDAVLAKNLVAGSGITIDNTSESQVIINNTSSSLSSDPRPSLGAPMNGNTLPIAKIAEPSASAVATFNAVWGPTGVTATIDELVLTKGYADRRYIQSTGGSGTAGQLRVRDEPADQSQYTRTISGYNGSNNVNLPGHGFDSGSDGIAFTYNSTGSNATNLEETKVAGSLTVGRSYKIQTLGTTDFTLIGANENTIGTVFSASGAGTGTGVVQPVYHLKYVDSNFVSMHYTSEDAKAGTNKIYPAGGTGTQTLTDAYLNTSLAGNYLSNEALPRKSVVRRQGDTMTGPLFLSDHPGALTGAGTPNGADDLQAATKYYVDNSSFASQVNLFVANSGDDSQVNTPPGKEGSAYAYAYATVGAACYKAEEILDLAKLEPGPYRQKITYSLSGVVYTSETTGVSFSGGTGYTAVQTLLNLNREYIRAETVAYINATYPDLNYDQDLCSRDVGLIIDAVVVDVLVNGNWQSVNAGKSYFRNASAKVASSTQQLETVAGIVYAQYLADRVLNKVDPAVSYQSVYTRQTDLASVSGLMTSLVSDKFDTIINIIQNGPTVAPVVDYGTGQVEVLVSNGGAGYVDQGQPGNVDIIPGKLIRGLRTGAVGKITSYSSGGSEDTILVNLLTPQNFDTNEEIEFAEANKEIQVTIHVESGIYYEDYPIRVPANVTIRGNDFRRCIIRPKDRASQSPWIETYFYRDNNFDGLDLNLTSNPYTISALVADREFLKKEIVAWIAAQVAGNIAPFTTGFTYNEVKCARDVGLIIDALITDIKYGGNAKSYYAASLYYNGVVSKISGQEAQTSAAIDQLKNIIYNYILAGANYIPLQTVVAQSTTSAGSFVIGQRYTITVVGTTDFTLIGAASNTLGVSFTATGPGTGSGTARINPGYTESTARTKASDLLTSISSVITNGLSNLTAAFGDYDSPEYGYHYLENPGTTLNIGPSYSNAGNYVNAAKLIEENKEFIKSEVTAYITAVYPGFVFDSAKSLRDTGLIVDAIIADLKAGGKTNTVSVAASFYNSSSVVNSTECIAGIMYINTVAQQVISNIPLTALTVPPKRGTVDQVIDNTRTTETPASAVIANLIGSVTFAFDPAYNPPKNNKDLDVFLFNDAVRVSNITGQGHGGFMCVLDPSGQIGSKSPYVQESASFMGSRNKQNFGGGMFIDGFSGRLPCKITSTGGLGLLLTVSGLTKRRPIAPTAFYYNGFRYQVDNVASWNAISGVATLNLNPSTPWSGGNLDIILETPGNRSMLANDYTQVNDLGYGIVAHNGGLTEQVSTFTYYCYTAYFASKGGQVRSVAGSNANGIYGLKADGSDPTEIPDAVALYNNMTQTAKIYRYGDYSSTSKSTDLLVYIKRYNFIPDRVSELEIDHGNGTIGRYEVTTAQRTGLNQNQYEYRVTNVSKASTAVVTLGTNFYNSLSVTATGSDLITVASTATLYAGMPIVFAGTTLTGSNIVIGTTYYVMSGFTATQFSISATKGSTTAFTVGTNTGGGPMTATVPITITAATKAFPCVLTTSSAHGLVDRDVINIADVSGMTQINGGTFYVKVTGYSTTSFGLYADASLNSPVDSSLYSTYTSGGYVTSSIKFYAGDRIRMTGVFWNGSSAAFNGNKYYVKPLTYNTAELYTSYNSSTGVFSSPLDTSGYTGTFTAPSTYTGITAGSFVAGREYIILSAGTTNFTLVGAANSNPGTRFTATGVGSGTGTAYEGGTLYEKVTYSVSAITKANPCQITFTEAHHFANGHLINVSGVGGMTQVDGLYYVKVNGSTTVQLYSDATLATAIDSSTFNTYTSGGTVFGGLEILQVGLSSTGNDNRLSSGIAYAVSDHTNITFRGLQNFRFTGIENVNPTRPSTALEYDLTGTTYRLISYGNSTSEGSLMPDNQAILTADTSFNYIKPVTYNSKLNTVDPVDGGTKTMGATIGDTRIAIYDFDGTSLQSTRDLLNSGTLFFAWAGKVHRIINYTSVNGATPAYITIVDYSDNNNYSQTATGIAAAFPSTSSVTLRSGLGEGASGAITIKISTCRATGHDFLDIGTGGFNTSNYPTAIYGNPALSADQTKEVVETNKGRVFYVTTDQNGIFRVGKFFKVDQGTGTVTFSASIALSNLDGLGFKQGVTVNEFSTDDTFTANASEKVPVERATRAYIDKRLGLDHNGGQVPVPNRIGPGYLPLTGALGMTGNLQMGGYQIKNLASPTDNLDAANKAYVDFKSGQYNQFSELSDVATLAPVQGDLVVYTGGIDNSVVSATITGDIAPTYTSTNTGTLDSAIIGTTQVSVSAGIIITDTSVDITQWPAVGFFQIDDEIFSYTSRAINAPSPGKVTFQGIVRARYTTSADSTIAGSLHSAGAVVLGLNNARMNLQIVAGTIVNADVNASAAIAQSKLALNDATAAASAGAATKGIASFNSATFDSSSGYVSVKAGGISKSQIENVGNGAVLGNVSGSASAPQEVTVQNVLKHGTYNEFSGTAVNGVPYSYTFTKGASFGASSFGIRQISSSGAASSIVSTDSSSNIDVAGLKLSGNIAVSVSGTTIKFTTPGGVEVISALGSSEASTPVTLKGQFTLGASSTLAATTATDATNATNVYVSGTPRAAATTATANTIAARDASGDIYANLFQGTATAARFADLAEYYTSDREYDPGTVLVFGGSEETTTTTIFGDARLAGVVSTDPGFIMNSELQGTRACIALQGRVPCKVVGRVKKGDLLTTSAIPGHAAKAIDPKIGTIIGKALEDKDYTEAGIIEVAVGRV